MADNAVSRILGRRIRLAVVGGGGDGLIGPAHRTAARLDDLFEIKAGVLSSDPERSVAQARELGIERGYPSMAALIEGERGRADAADAVSICTPNDSHHELASLALDGGFDVICDKPLTNDLESARDLVTKVRANGRVFALTHNYSGYPMVRQARAMVGEGTLGRLHLVHVSYMQGSLSTLVEADLASLPSRTRWRLDPAKGGASHVMLDIGTHAHQLTTYVTGMDVEAVMADVGAVLPGRTGTHDTGMVLLRFTNGAKGVLLASKLAAGAENALSIEAYGSGGGIFWEQADQNRLRFMRQNEPAQLFVRGLAANHPIARRATRVPIGHPEGFFESFANLYADFAEQVAARIAGQAPAPDACHVPTVEDGAKGLAFVEACVRSTIEGRWIEVPRIA